MGAGSIEHSKMRFVRRSWMLKLQLYEVIQGWSERGLRLVARIERLASRTLPRPNNSMATTNVELLDEPVYAGVMSAT